MAQTIFKRYTTQGNLNGNLIRKVRLLQISINLITSIISACDTMANVNPLSGSVLTILNKNRFEKAFNIPIT